MGLSQRRVRIHPLMAVARGVPFQLVEDHFPRRAAMTGLRLIPQMEKFQTPPPSVDKGTSPPSTRGRPKLIAGRMVNLTTINKSRPIVNSANKLLSVEVENPLMNKPGDLIGLNISLNKENRTRGRPKRPASAIRET